MKLVQRHLLKGTRELELADELIHVRIRTFLRLEKSSLALSMLNPEPVVEGSCLVFHARVGGDPLLSLFVDNPDRDSFVAFVAELQRRARDADAAFAGPATGAPAAEPIADGYAEPPDFDAPPARHRNRQPVRAVSIATSIRMLEQHLGRDGIEPLLEALAALQARPDDTSRLDRLVDAFEKLGPRQGAVLTYAPYLGILLADVPFDF